MSWWARARLRTKIFLAFSGLILVLLLASTSLVQVTITAHARHTLDAQLRVTGQVFERLLADRAERLLTNSTLLAGDFALKRALATYDPATLASVAANYQNRIGVDLFWIADDEGALLADSQGRHRPGERLLPTALRTAVEAGDAASALTVIDDTLYQLVAVPVLAPDVIGHLVLGRAIDDATARRLETETGSAVSFVSARQVFASSWDSAHRAALFPTGAPAAAWLNPERPQPFLVQRAPERLLSIVRPVKAELDTPVYALVQRSYDAALAPLQNLHRQVLAIGGVSLLVALLVGAGLAGGITAPLRALMAGMQDVLRGNFGRRLPVRRADELGFLASSFNEMVAGLEEREKIKDTFGRYVSQAVADAILEERVPLAGETRDVTVLFQDIRGFTSISERLAPVVLLGMLNRFLTEMVAAVECEGGVVRQFTGDGLMAMFGAPVAHADDPARAVRAGLDMARRLDGLNVALARDGLPVLRIGVGVHTGEVVAGRLGPDTRLEYSVIGDAVNLASRIEGLTKEMHATVLVSGVTAARLGPEFQRGRAAVLPIRGKDQPVEVVEVVGLASW